MQVASGDEEFDRAWRWEGRWRRGKHATCSHCGLAGRPFMEPDPCLGRLPGVSFACCGHGDPHRAYVVIARGDGARFRFPPSRDLERVPRLPLSEMRAFSSYRRLARRRRVARARWSRSGANRARALAIARRGR